MFSALQKQSIRPEPSASLQANPQLKDDVITLITHLKNGYYGDVSSQGNEISQALFELANHLQWHARNNLSSLVKVSVEVNETGISSARVLHALRKIDLEATSAATCSEEMVGTIKSLEELGGNVKNQSSDITSTMNTMQISSTDTVHKIDRIEQAVTQSDESVRRVTSFVQEISRLLGVIGDISNKTNLLALNATIEAARAGEVGRGFAVVAGEVKALSVQTRKTTDDIATILANLEKGMRELSGAIDDNKSSVEEGKTAINAVNGLIGDVVSHIDDLNGNIGDMWHALAEQRKTLESLSYNVVTIAGTVKESVSSIDHCVTRMGNIEKHLSEALNESMKLDIPNKVILIAQSDHVIWKRRLANMVIGREGLNHKELADHHSCRLGKWYDAVKDDKLRDDPLFKSLIKPHEQVHHYGIEAVKLYNAGRIEAALEEITKVDHASAEVLRILAELARRY